MSATTTRAGERTRAGRPERLLFAVLVFQGLSAILGGGMLLSQVAGRSSSFPEEWLDRIPFDSWVGPGVILGVGLGVSALVVAYGVRRRPRWPWLAVVERSTRHHWSWAGAIGLGVGLMAWIVVQPLLLGGWSPLQPTYFAVGAAITGLALSHGVRRALRVDPVEGPRGDPGASEGRP